MRYGILILMTVLLPGCVLELLTTTAIQADLQAQQASAAQNTLNRVTNDTGQINLQRAIDLYQAEKAAYPASLDLLVPGFIDAIPTRADGGNFGYNPVTGKVLDDDSGPAPADYLMMEQILAAINAYGTATGYYPPTLEALAAAGYLPVFPRTATGDSFQYNNQNGAVAHPLEGPLAVATPAPAPRTGSNLPAGGGGPMGEAMTGIAIQQQLNSNSNAGTSAASGRGRAGARDAAAQQSDRQVRALDDLGF